MKHLEVDYTRRCQGDLTAVATLTPEQQRQIADHERGEVDIAQMAVYKILHALIDRAEVVGQQARLLAVVGQQIVGHVQQSGVAAGQQILGAIADRRQLEMYVADELATLLVVEAVRQSGAAMEIHGAPPNPAVCAACRGDPLPPQPPAINQRSSPLASDTAATLPRKLLQPSAIRREPRHQRPPSATRPLDSAPPMPIQSRSRSSAWLPARAR